MEKKKYQALEQFGRNLSLLAEQGRLDPVIGRDQEIRRIVEVLSRRTKNNPVLIGEPGVGKTAIAEGLSLRIIKKDVPQVLWNKKIISLDLASMVAGSQFQGSFEARIKAVIKEIQESKGEIIIFIDELHNLVGAGRAGTNAMDASQILKPALARGDLRAIGATTLDEYRNFIEKDKALERRFQVVHVKEPSPELALTILRGLKEKYEVYHGVRIQDQALVAAVKLSHRYISNRFLPDKAVDLIDESASHLNMEIHSVPSVIDEIKRKITHLKVEQKALTKESDPKSTQRLKDIEKELNRLNAKDKELSSRWEQEKSRLSSLRDIKAQIEQVRSSIERAEREARLDKVAELKYGKLPELEKKLKSEEQYLKGKSGTDRLLKEEVGPDEIAAVVSRWTGIPLNQMLKSETKKLLQMESTLNTHIIGQRESIKSISDCVLRSRSGVADPNKPIGSFIFLGPTGVGKTATALELARFLFNSKNALIRIDMSEYTEKHQVSRLIGAPPGYVGFEEGGQLTERVRRQAYSVILFDEIEKAHPEVFHTLLQVLDEGHLTDSQGRIVNFKNTVLIMTSNLDPGLTAKDKKLPLFKQQEITRKHLHTFFRPEFMNRIDDILLFQNLSHAHIIDIVKLQIQNIRERLKDKNIGLHLDDKALNFLAKRGFDAEYGARPLKRVLQRELLNPIAGHIISNSIKEGGRVAVSAHDLNLELKIT